MLRYRSWLINIFAQVVSFFAIPLLILTPSTPVIYQEEVPPVPKTLEEKIDDYAGKYGVSAYQMSRIIQCESGGKPIQSAIVTKNGGREDSWGIVQIHLPSHPTITKEQALDTDFALDFLASNLSQGRISMWHGYRPKTDTCAGQYTKEMWGVCV